MIADDERPEDEPTTSSQVKSNLRKAYALPKDTSAVFDQLLDSLRDRERARRNDDTD
jgi:hypothetical protein